MSSKNQFEQLIEYVINDEDAKARELFHQIVVSKSRQIYENLMQEDDMSPEMNAMGDMQGQGSEMEEDMEEGRHDRMMGGSATGKFIDEVEMEEEGMHESEDDEDDTEDADHDAEEAGHDMTKDMEDERDMDDDEAASKSDVMDLSDKLDELMAQFEDMMGGGDDMGGMGMDDDGMSPEETDDAEYENEGMMENISLKQVHPKVTTHEEGDGKAGPVAFNAGQTGMEGRPVRAGKNEGGHHDTAAYKNTTKDLIGKVGNTPAQAKQDLKPATKPHLGQASGVNTRTPFPRGGK
jgi:hypothetical protein